MRILHLVTWLNQGGVEKWLLSMLREIDTNVCRMDICCKGANVGKLAPMAEALGSKVFHCPLSPSHIGFVRRLARIINDGEYDLIHNHLGMYSGVPVWVADRLGVPTISTFHSSRRVPQARWLMLPVIRQAAAGYAWAGIRYALRHSKLVTGVSRGVLESLPLDTNGIREKSHVLYLGTSVPNPATAEERSAFRRDLGWQVDTPLIIHIGSFRPAKNHQGLLVIFKKVLDQIPQAKLILVGDGPDRAVVEAAIARMKIGQSVRLLGISDDVDSLLIKCDLFLFPSIYEGFGLAALEANAAGLPVVGTSIRGLQEAVEDGRTAVLHDAKDVEGMAQSAIRILSDKDYARELGEAGRTRVKQHFSVAASARGLMELYFDCLDRREH